MRARAPGKLVVSGAYAVLDGAPAVVFAVDRYAVADASDPVATDHSAPAEVRAAFGTEPPPRVDVSALQDAAGRKLGLGSSAAAVVAALGARARSRGEDLASPAVRGAVFGGAREAHARVQQGGSGVDVAASTYGGALVYTLRGGDAAVRAAPLPEGLVLSVFASGESARTSDLRARVDDARVRHPREHAVIAAAMQAGAHAAAEAFVAGDSSAFTAAVAAYGALLGRLGHIAGAPIVPAGWEGLADRAVAEGSAFLPSGAGGGDVALCLGPRAPSQAFFDSAAGLGLQPLDVSIDLRGLCPA
jgi:phosphomevalonate kinase